MRISKLLTILAALCLVLCVGTAQAAAPSVTLSPESVTVRAGGQASFRAEATGYKGITWRLYNPANGEIVLASKAAARFGGLRVKGQNARTLTLSSIPASMNGWGVYCTFNNGSRRSETEKAWITVTDAPAAAAAPAEAVPEGDDDGPEATARPVAEGEVRRVVGVNATLQYLNRSKSAAGASYQEIDFTEPYINPVTGAQCAAGMLDFKVTSALPKGQKVETWVINGVPYRFNRAVNGIRVLGLQESVTIEAVPAGGRATTLGVVPEGGVSGEDRKVAVSIHATMLNLDSAGTRGGTRFRELDFTDPWINQNTGATEEGGHTSLNVAASVPNGKRVAYWKFNGARLYMGDGVIRFDVVDLDRSMTYEPVFVSDATPAPTAPPTATPVPRYTVTCRNCWFSGGGYSNATSGTVPKGTKITVTGNGSSGTFSGSRSGHMDNGNVYVKFTYTVNSNSTFTFVEDIN